MIPRCKQSEERLVDFVLGKLSAEAEATFRRHLQACPECREKHKEWRRLLADGPEVPEPSPRLKHRIISTFAKQRPAYSLLQRLRKHVSGRKTAFAILGSVCLLLSVFLYQGGVNESNDSHQPWTTHEETIRRQTSVVYDPRTVQLNITPVSMQNIEGRVWVNDVTHEMLMKVEGLIPLMNNDYQVWLIRSNDHLNGGVLREENGKAYLYLSGVQPRSFEHIRVSIEPKGGSVAPTGPDTFFVRLKNEQQPDAIEQH